nr:putative ribonuclease H-like domain-containing protein [Tanacetum cinerariifolium]
MVYQMDVKSAFLYGAIEEEVCVCQPTGFEDPDHLDKFYKVVKALYGLHQAPRAWYETLANYLLENGFQRSKIYQTLFIKRQKYDILLVQIYVDDIIFGATNKDLCKYFEKLMKNKFQMSSMGEITFFLGLQVKQKKDGIFISQDKYVAEILRKFGLTEGKSASTPIDTEKPLLKDPDGEDVNVHTYRSMIGSLTYLISSRPDIMFAVVLEWYGDFKNDVPCSKYLKCWFTHHTTNGSQFTMSNPRQELSSPDQTVSGKDSSNSLTADNLPKIVWYSTHHVALMKSWLVQKQTTLGVNTPRCDEDRLELIELTVLLLQKVEKVRIGVSTIDQQVSAVRHMLLLFGLTNCFIKYALIVDPNIYVSCIKQFWTTFAVKKVNDVIRLQALVDKKKVVVTEAKIREAFCLDDAEGVECLPNEEIFAELARMGYEKPSTKLTFYKAFFSSQSKFLIHTILQCMSAKRTSWNEFSSSMASVVICLSSGDADENNENVNAVDAAEGDVSAAHGEVPTVADAEPSIPSPTPPTPPQQPSHDIPSTSQVQPTPPQSPQVQPQSPPVQPQSPQVQPPSPQPQPQLQPQQDAGILMHLLQEVMDTCVALTRRVEHLELDKVAQAIKIIKLKQRVKKMERRNKVKVLKLKRLQNVGTTRRVETSDETVMDDVSNQERMIAEMDQDADVVLEDDKEVADDVKDAQDDIDEMLKRKPQTEAQARKNMMVYLKNVVGFKMDYFKGMSYDDICPIFEAKFNTNVAFLQKTKEHIEEEESRALKRLNETLAEKAAKRKKLNEEIIELNNKPYYKIIRADDTHQFYTWSNIRKARYTCSNIKESKKCTWSSKGQGMEAIGIMWCADHNVYNHTTDFVSRKEYPLTRFTLDQMLNAVRLEVEEESEVSLELLSKGQGMEAIGIMWCADHNVYNHTTDFVSRKEYPLTRFTLDQMLNAVRLEVEEESEVSLELMLPRNSRKIC